MGGTQANQQQQQRPILPVSSSSASGMEGGQAAVVPGQGVGSEHAARQGKAAKGETPSAVSDGANHGDTSTSHTDSMDLVDGDANFLDVLVDALGGDYDSDLLF